jgi:hypothetical protein
LARVHDAWHVVAAARLKQQHGDVRVLGQSARYYGPGRTRPADDEVVVRLEVRTKLPLIETNAFGKLRRGDA